VDEFPPCKGLQSIIRKHYTAFVNCYNIRTFSQSTLFGIDAFYTLIFQDASNSTGLVNNIVL
jgi:hypothetical protein